MSGKVKKVYVGFGANKGDPLETYLRARALLEEALGKVQAESAMYESEALTLDGTPSQSHYINAALLFRSDLSPRAVLDILLGIERTLGRERVPGERWMPRTIDLDLLLIEGSIVQEPGLSLPHPELHKRDFVLGPLCDIDPTQIHPELGLTVGELYQSLNERGFQSFVFRTFTLKPAASNA